ncbi:unnamed protein product [Onchocerca flexuosa]|uniref:Secreted protein n=1 Tax=Onchocerca flexuosa TaxID=387005 RepID=A0A183I5H9_9BILA|nr:unnamed protein product [Onchocerca flexuosa]
MANVGDAFVILELVVHRLLQRNLLLVVEIVVKVKMAVEIQKRKAITAIWAIVLTVQAVEMLVGKQARMMQHVVVQWLLRMQVSLIRTSRRRKLRMLVLL